MVSIHGAVVYVSNITACMLHERVCVQRLECEMCGSSLHCFRLHSVQL